MVLCIFPTGLKTTQLAWNFHYYELLRLKLPPDVFIIRRFQKNAKVGPRSGKVEREKSSQVPDRKSTSKDKPQLLNIKITQNGSKSFELPNPPTKKAQFDLGFCGVFFFLAPKKKLGAKKNPGHSGRQWRRQSWCGAIPKGVVWACRAQPATSTSVKSEPLGP